MELKKAESSGIDPKQPDAFWQVIFQANPLPMFIVDEDVRIGEYNAAAGGFFKESKSKILRHRGGDALHCVHAIEGPEGCGTGAYCKTCMIRNSVTKAIQGNATHRVRAKMELLQDGRTVRIQLLVTATPIQFEGRQFVLLILENITELLTLRELLPVCAHCKKIRDDQEYWHEIDAYFAEHMEMNFSHGVCPDCMKKFFEEFDREESVPK